MVKDPNFTKSSAKTQQMACANKRHHQRAWFYLCFCVLGTKLMAAQQFTVCSSTAEGGRLSHCVCPSLGSPNRAATSQLIRGKCRYAPWGRACDRLPVCMIPLEPWFYLRIEPLARSPCLDTHDSKVSAFLGINAAYHCAISVVGDI